MFRIVSGLFGCTHNTITIGISRIGGGVTCATGTAASAGPAVTAQSAEPAVTAQSAGPARASGTSRPALKSLGENIFQSALIAPDETSDCNSFCSRDSGENDWDSVAAAIELIAKSPV
jgi:hypothetical protein